MGIQDYRFASQRPVATSTSLRRRVRWLLLGSDDTWGATLATGPLGILALATLAIVLQVMDLTTGLRMMLVHGIGTELNPLARTVMSTAGPLGLAELKLGVVLLGILIFVETAHAGRRRLARNCLLMVAALGLLGFASNLIG